MRSSFSTFATLLSLVGTGLMAAELGQGVLAAALEGAAPAAVAEELPLGAGKNFDAPWPQRSSLGELPPATIVCEDAAQGCFIYETAHFRFISPAKLELPAVEELARVFEGTYTACCQLPLNFTCRRYGAEGSSRPQEKMVARLFLTMEDFHRETGRKSSEGLFRDKEVLVPFPSLGLEEKEGAYRIAPGRKLDATTLIHELTHQMSLMDRDYDFPIWLAEGMAEYMRLAPYSGGSFDFSGMRRRIIPYVVGGPGTTGRQLGRELAAPRLEEFLNMSARRFQTTKGFAIHFNYGFAALCTYYFIYLDGEGDAARLKAWMEHLQQQPRAASQLAERIPLGTPPAQRALIQRQLDEKAANLKEEYYYAPLLDGRSWEELEEEFTRKIKQELGIEVSFGS